MSQQFVRFYESTNGTSVGDIASSFGSRIVPGLTRNFSHAIRQADECAELTKSSWFPRNLTAEPATICPDPCPTGMFFCQGSVPGNINNVPLWDPVLVQLRRLGAEVMSADIPCNLIGTFWDKGLIERTGECAASVEECAKAFRGISRGLVGEMEAEKQRLKWITTRSA